MKLVLVEWVDSAFAQGWMHKDAIRNHRVSKIASAGILVNDTKEHITIVQSVSDKDDRGDGITIPRCSIKRIRHLAVRNNGTHNNG